MIYSEWTSQSYSLHDLHDLVEENKLKQVIANLSLALDGRIVPVGLYVYDKWRPKSQIGNGGFVQGLQNQFLLDFFEAFLESVLDRNLAPLTIMTRIAYLKNFLASVPESKSISRKNAIEYFSAYTERLVHETRIYDAKKRIGITALTANKRQSEVRYVLKILFGHDSCNSVGSILANRRQSQPTECPSSRDVVFTLSHHTSIFVQLNEILSREETFPAKISIHSNDYYLFPSRARFIDDRVTERDTTVVPPNQGFDYSTGKCRTREELCALHPAAQDFSKKQILRKIEFVYTSARVRIDEANKSRVNQRRIGLLNYLVRSYFNHFLIVTGMNPKQVCDLTVDTIEFNPGRKKFTSIKLRAQGRVVKFEIQTLFIKYFDLFLECRAMVLDELALDENHLFLSYDATSEGTFTVRKFHSRFRIPFAHILPPLTSRHFRVFKGQWVSDRYGVDVASFALQHSKVTNIVSYQTAAQGTVDREVTNFLDQLEQSVKIAQRGSQGVITTVAGGCLSLNDPHIRNDTESGVSFEPNCERFEGCLFCMHYVLHADGEDIRKLHSLIFLSNIYRRISDSEESFDLVYQPLIDRAKNLLFRIGGISADLFDQVAAIKDDVFLNENLDPYWMKKYELLEELGLL